MANPALPVLDILKDLPTVLENFTRTASNTFQKVFEITTALSEKEEELRTLHRTLQHNSKKAAEKVREFIEYVNELYQYGKVSFEQNKYTNHKMLSDVIHVISKCISQAVEAFTEAKESLEVIQKDSATAEMKCKVLARDAKHKKAVGETLAGGAIAAGTAGGVAASVVAGLFTFGIGTIVVLSLTAAGSFAAGAAVGATTAVVTHVVPDFEELEKNFRSLSIDFKKLLYQDSSKMLELLERSNQRLSSLSRFVERAQKTQSNEILFKFMLTCLKEQCNKNAKRTEGCVEELKKTVASYLAI